MNIGIVLYSQNGHTHAFGRVIASALRSDSHSVEILPLTTKQKVHPGMHNVVLEKTYDLSSFDALCFGSPVWALSLTPIMATFLGTMKPITNKKCAIFATMGFPLSFLGGTRACAQMRKQIVSHGGLVVATHIVPLMLHNFKNCTESGAKRIASAFLT